MHNTIKSMQTPFNLSEAILDEKTYEAMLDRMYALDFDVTNKTVDEEAELAALAQLVGAYDAVHYAIAAPTPEAAAAFMHDQNTVPNMFSSEWSWTAWRIRPTAWTSNFSFPVQVIGLEPRVK